MDDAQSRPKDSDRAGLVARIKQAADGGRISGADRDIRLGNVASATSRSELDLMNRELDQLDQPEDSGDDSHEDDVPGISTDAVPARVVGIIVSVVVAIAIVVGGVVWLGYRSGSKDTPASGSGSGGQPGVTPRRADPGATYSLTEKGMTGFLKTYRKRFATGQAVELTLYEDYAIVGVPVPGKARQSGWLYRNGRWTDFGGTRAVFPGSGMMDIDQLDVPALVRNIARARSALNVEGGKVYVVVRSLKQVDAAPRVDVHVSNSFNESGYLATTMAGKVIRSYPYSAQ